MNLPFQALFLLVLSLPGIAFRGQEKSWPDPRYYRIEGDYVVLPASQILNLNIRYVFVDIE